jgi:hypothetical protein
MHLNKVKIASKNVHLEMLIEKSYNRHIMWSISINFHQFMRSYVAKNYDKLEQLA